MSTDVVLTTRALGHYTEGERKFLSWLHAAVHHSLKRNWKKDQGNEEGPDTVTRPMLSTVIEDGPLLPIAVTIKEAGWPGFPEERRKMWSHGPTEGPEPGPATATHSLDVVVV
ncbi:hypothetical protein INR49_022994 [Caranx melampygus]|nr:hypothetical protein INR49_022994 [Caranx melampygus]